MSIREPQQGNAGNSTFEGQKQHWSASPEAVLEELFLLLEEYGPMWYTVEHHNRAVAAVSGGSAIWLSMLKDELFAIESEKLSGTLSQTEYAEIKLGLDAVLKRVLNRKSASS